jgi:hypothetical protein
MAWSYIGPRAARELLFLEKAARGINVGQSGECLEATVCRLREEPGARRSHVRVSAWFSTSDSYFPC